MRWRVIHSRHVQEQRTEYCHLTGQHLERDRFVAAPGAFVGGGERYEEVARAVARDPAQPPEAHGHAAGEALQLMWQ